MKRLKHIHHLPKMSEAEALYHERLKRISEMKQPNGEVALIELSKDEKQWIKFCKNHYKDIYQISASSWIDSIKPLFQDIYGWDPDESYNDYLECIFNKLLDIHLKIKYDQSGCDAQLKDIFKAAFHKSFRRHYELPIERAIAELCGQIQCNQVMEGEVTRYYL